ncbi:MAG: DUF4156 domain-containing protein [Gammaproteobacteria bacterium]|nr:DUF4156 domain-containing protein [Gammaproteobacteria bacterium]
MKIKTSVIATSILLSACSTLSLTDEGEKVRVLDPSEVDSCRELGKTNTSVTAKVIIERPAEDVAKELRIVSRNSAARMGGDTIVPLTVAEAGQQTFVVYKCVNPDG